MSKNTENYRKSLYLSTKVLSSRQECTVEKVVNSFDGEVYVRRTYRENKSEIFRILSEINSPYLPEIVEIFGDDEETVIIEKHIEGDTLAALITDKKLTKIMAKSCARQLLSALSAIQEKEIVHRDIKPENIMFSDGKLTLIDFGIARIYKENETHDTKHLGTEGYAAPEQYGFSQSDKRTDIYSAGKTILKMCETASVAGRTKKTAQRCAQFAPQNRFETARDALKYLENIKGKLCIASSTGIVVTILALLFVHYPVSLAKTEPVPVETEKIQQTQIESSTHDKKETKKYEKTETPVQGTKREKTVTAKENDRLVETETKIQAESLQKTETVVDEGSENADEVALNGMEKMLNGGGENMLLSHKGEIKNSASKVIAFGNGNNRKVSAQISARRMLFNIGDQTLAIPFDRYIEHFNSDTDVIDACVKFCDIDVDGIKEIFVAVCSRHGYCVGQSALWFAKQINDKFILCDAPLSCNSAGVFTLLPKFKILSDDCTGDAYCINGTKFEKVK